MNDAGLTLMIFGPALLGLATLVIGVMLLRKPADDRANTTVRTVIGAVCLIFTLGVGACYGLMLLS